MSTTLEPLDVFAEVTGLRHLESEPDRPDERYARDTCDSVRDLICEAEREAFRPVGTDMLGHALEQFCDE